MHYAGIRQGELSQHVTVQVRGNGIISKWYSQSYLVIINASGVNVHISMLPGQILINPSTVLQFSRVPVFCRIVAGTQVFEDGYTAGGQSTEASGGYLKQFIQQVINSP